MIAGGDIVLHKYSKYYLQNMYSLYSIVEIKSGHASRHRMEIQQAIDTLSIVTVVQKPIESGKFM